MFVFFDLCFGFVASPIIYSRIFFRADTPVKNPALQNARRGVDQLLGDGRTKQSGGQVVDVMNRARR